MDMKDHMMKLQAEGQSPVGRHNPDKQDNLIMFN
jgi:hypothetical protein